MNESFVVFVAHIRLLYTDYQDVAIVYVCSHLVSRALCSASAPGHVDVYTRAPSLADERRRSMLDHLRYHGYDGVTGVVAKAGFNASNLATVIHRGKIVHFMDQGIVSWLPVITMLPTDLFRARVSYGKGQIWRRC